MIYTFSASVSGSDFQLLLKFRRTNQTAVLPQPKRDIYIQCQCFRL
nr:MAG TPA_asm: hypothetical protein [Caudoviricetes sp.]